MTIVEFVCEKTGIKEISVKNTIELLEEGNTIPFIARYRKEKTHHLDEVKIEEIKKWSDYFNEITERRNTILKTIEEQGKLTDELKKRIENTWDKQKLEDLYLPYKPKKRTKATMAKEKGLEPLYNYIMEKYPFYEELKEEGKKYINEEKGVKTEDEAVKGAFDIWAENISENAQLREKLRELFWEEGIINVKKRDKAEDPHGQFADYYEFSEPVKRMQSHRYLAIKRGETKGILRFSIDVEDDKAIEIILSFIDKELQNREYTISVVNDAYKRLLKPSIESQIRQEKKEKSDDVSIEIFRKNLQSILLMPPAGEKVIMGVDPGIRTGSKLCVIDETGRLLSVDTIYPEKDKEKARNIIKNMIEKYNVEIIAIGNGTGSKEIYEFVKGMENVPHIQIVNEAGASVYSASQVAREELPDLDVSTRGAVSIARRLQDPLSELVKIDPKSIGVGQYQHDVNQKKLSLALESVVEFVVNKVGVDVNTASWTLLRYVSGISESLAKRIVEYRDKNGKYKNREELKNIKGMGDKTFQQCAGFLRIKNGENPLDASAVHPESYHIVEEICKDMQIGVKDIIGNEKIINQIDIEKYVKKGYGEYTLKDIIEELKKPGRDPRKKWEPFVPSEIDSIEKLKEGMIMTGMVTSVTAFGAFVDIGVHRDGLIHISKMRNLNITPGMVIKVKVGKVDIERNRIALLPQ